MTRAGAAVALLILCAETVAVQDRQPPRMHRVGGARDGTSAFLRVDYEQMKPKAAGDSRLRALPHLRRNRRAAARAGPRSIPISSICTPSASRSRAVRSGRSRSPTRRTSSTPIGRRSSSKAAAMPARSAASRRRSTSSTMSLTRYGSDADITRLVDTKTIYARPMNNPDGASLYHLTAQTLRSTVRAQRQRRRWPARRGCGRGSRRRRLYPADAQGGREGQGRLDQGSQGRERTRHAPRPRRRRRLRGPRRRGSTATATAATTKTASAGSTSTATTRRTGGRCARRPAAARRRSAPATIRCQSPRPARSISS